MVVISLVCVSVCACMWLRARLCARVRERVLEISRISYALTAVAGKKKERCLGVGPKFDMRKGDMAVIPPGTKSVAIGLGWVQEPERETPAACYRNFIETLKRHKPLYAKVSRLCLSLQCSFGLRLDHGASARPRRCSSGVGRLQ